MNQTNTLVNGSFLVVASRPGMGKTAFALDIAKHMAQQNDKNILFVSLETSTEQILSRLQKANGDKPANYSNIKICDKSLMTVKDIQELGERTNHLGAVIIDYAQLIRGTGCTVKEESKTKKMFEISNALARMARDLCVPVICTSQIRRTCDYRSDKRPTISDLCYDWVNEHDMDQIIFLYRDRYYNRETPVGEMAECIIAKNRYGDTGTIKLRWDSEKLVFSRWED